MARRQWLCLGALAALVECNGINPYSNTVFVNVAPVLVPDSIKIVVGFDNQSKPFSGDTVAFTDVVWGSHTVTFPGLASNCGSLPNTPDTVQVSPGPPPTFTFHITCR